LRAAERADLAIAPRLLREPLDGVVAVLVLAETEGAIENERAFRVMRAAEVLHRDDAFGDRCELGAFGASPARGNVDVALLVDDAEGAVARREGAPITNKPLRDREHRAFEIGILLKGANALTECVAGIALFFVPASAMAALAARLTQHELREDPRDFVAGHVMAWAQGFSTSQEQYYAIYLLSHGLIKLALVAALLARLLWAYPVSIVVLLAFVAYQLYRFELTGSWALIALSLFDLVVIWLIWQEYRSMQRG